MHGNQQQRSRQHDDCSSGGGTCLPQPALQRPGNKFNRQRWPIRCGEKQSGRFRVDTKVLHAIHPRQRFSDAHYRKQSSPRDALQAAQVVVVELEQPIGKAKRCLAPGRDGHGKQWNLTRTPREFKLVWLWHVPVRWWQGPELSRWSRGLPTVRRCAVPAQDSRPFPAKCLPA